MYMLTILMLLNPPSLEVARERAEALLRAYNAQKAVNIILPVEEAPDAPERLTASVTREVLTGAGERLPRAVFLTQPSCLPCKQMLQDIEGIAGDETYPVQVIDTTRDSGWLAKLGVPHSAILATPTVFILNSEGKVHDWNGGFRCRLTGRKTKAELISYLQMEEHKVDVTPPVPVEEAMMYSTSASSDSFGSILQHHLMGDVPVGGLFEFTVDVPDSLPGILNKLLMDQKWSNGVISVSWAGDRTISVSQGRMAFSPAPTVAVSKFGINITVKWTAVIIAEGGKLLTLELQGVPDLKVRFE